MLMRSLHKADWDTPSQLTCKISHHWFFQWGIGSVWANGASQIDPGPRAPCCSRRAKWWASRLMLRTAIARIYGVSRANHHAKAGRRYLHAKLRVYRLGVQGSLSPRITPQAYKATGLSATNCCRRRSDPVHGASDRQDPRAIVQTTSRSRAAKFLSKVVEQLLEASTGPGLA